MKIVVSVVAALVVLVLAVAVGSVWIAPSDIFQVLAHKLFPAINMDISQKIQQNIIWDIRLPRVLMACCAGAALSVSGAVLQSVLKNPLASSYTLGVSSGASLGAGLVFISILAKLSLGLYILPLGGFIGAILTVLLVLSLCRKLDKHMENTTVILMGMVFSLFLSAIMTLFMALSKDFMEKMIYWQMGSFAAKTWSQVGILSFVTFVLSILLLRYAKEMDVLTFGEEQAQSMGVHTSLMKPLLITLAACLTGAAISFVGVIGFVDLVAPHIVRRIFGAEHRLLLPLSALYGAMIMVLADLMARTLLIPRELPVGAITALIGAPFFIWVFFSRRKAEAL